MGLQVALLLAVASVAVFGSNWSRTWKLPFLVVGVVVMLAGAVLVLAGARSLGPALTPLPPA